MVSSLIPSNCEVSWASVFHHTIDWLKTSQWNLVGRNVWSLLEEQFLLLRGRLKLSSSLTLSLCLWEPFCGTYCCKDLSQVSRYRYLNILRRVICTNLLWQTLVLIQWILGTKILLQVKEATRNTFWYH